MGSERGAPIHVLFDHKRMSATACAFLALCQQNSLAHNGLGRGILIENHQISDTDGCVPLLNILLLEDSRFDADLIVKELRKLGHPFRLDAIQSEAELRHALAFRPPDVILSDHGLPSFDGFRALEIVREEKPELPFIFVSGSNNQQMVVDMHDLGATDYVFKRDLVNLCPTIKRALKKPGKKPALELNDFEFDEVTVPQTYSSTGRIQF